ncbi:uncharacterized protein VP01_2013g1 [Puccinia sorghi]|uniref:Uncharacterized protein n=1 Tax=Puccinia sorghi TaxID=27349 RepID=A0A0L6VD35_9BASI|nr:uncharacterized protein VP01_2013g1 [Puccinia sorghi]
MHMMGKECAQQLDTEENLRQTQARLDATAGQQNPAPAQPNPAPAPASNPMVLAKTQPFDGTRGAVSKVFVGQIGLHAVTYPESNKTPLHQTLMKWTSCIPEGPQPTLHRQASPLGPAEPLFPLPPGGPHIPWMFEWGSETPRLPTTPIFCLDLQTLGGNQLSPHQPQHQ